MSVLFFTIIVIAGLAALLMLVLARRPSRVKMLDDLEVPCPECGKWTDSVEKKCNHCGARMPSL